MGARAGARLTGRRTAYSQRMPWPRAAASTEALSSTNSVRAGSKGSRAANRGQKCGVLLRVAELVRAVDGVEPPADAELGVLEREDLRVRVRDQGDALAGRPHAREEAARLGQPVDLVARRALHRQDVERERAAPVVDAVPVERAGRRLEDRPHEAARLLDRDAAALGEAARQVLLPETLVVAEVEQRAVHVEQHGVDGGPFGKLGASLHVPMI